VERRDLKRLGLQMIGALTVASGWCGIAYELLYSRLLTTYLGDMFHVNAAILTSFLLGIGLGAGIARRFARWLWLVEILIGTYAICVAVALFGFPTQLLQYVIPRLSAGPGITAVVAIACTFVPASLIGFSVPLFSIYLRRAAQSEAEGGSFRRVYWLYNLGAGLCVLAMEYGFLRWWGIRATLVCLGSINWISGLLLLLLGSSFGQDVRAPALKPELPREGLGLLFASALSGLYQLFLLKLSEILFGPFHENFALLLALSLTGIAVASYLVQKRRLRFEQVLLRGAVVISVVFVCFGPLIYLWASLNGAFGVTPWLSRLIKIGMLVAFGAGPILVFGATVPSLIHDASTDDRAAGQLLSISSLGNCIGYLAAVFLIYERVSYALLAFVFPAGLMAIAAGQALKKRQPIGWSSIVAVALLAVIPFAWPTALLRLSYREYIKPDILNRAMANVAGFEELRKFDENVKLIRTAAGETEVVINGYRSLVSSHSGKTNVKELIVGAAPALFAEKRDRALVLGVGTGITAGAAASLFKRTVGVEINPAVLAALPRFAEHNLHLLERPDFELVLDDGLTFLARTDQRFDAIINTVTSPLYFSSSKLYTREFFELAKNRLAPGGVYAMWFDSRVTPEGAKIIFETIRQSFVDCQLVYLSPVYSEVICGAQRLGPHRLSENEWPFALRDKIGAERFHLSTTDFVESLLLPDHHIMTTRWGAPINPFDRPQLEFLMASVALGEVDPKKAWTPYRLAGVDLTSSVREPKPLTSEAFANRCFVFRAVGGVEYPDCPSPFGRSAQSLPLAYLENMLQLLDYTESPSAVLTIAEQIGARGNLDWALSILDRMDKRLKGRIDYRELRARLQFERDGRVNDEELIELYRLAPLSPNLRRLAARVCAQRGQAEQALAHLAILRRLGGLNPVDQQLAEALARRFAPVGSQTP
jgi:spermidine synthase